MSHLLSVSNPSGGIISLLTISKKPPERFQTQAGNRKVGLNDVGMQANVHGQLLYNQRGQLEIKYLLLVEFLKAVQRVKRDWQQVPKYFVWLWLFFRWTEVDEKIKGIK